MYKNHGHRVPVYKNHSTILKSEHLGLVIDSLYVGMDSFNKKLLDKTKWFLLTDQNYNGTHNGGKERSRRNNLDPIIY